MRRGAIAAGALCLLASAGAAAAQAPQQRPPRPAREAAIPLPPPPAPPLPVPLFRPVLPGDPAPIPNRDIEAPYRPEDPVRTRLEPTLITPQTTRRGQTFGSEHAPDRDDQLFREPAAGARLRIPLN